MSTDTRAFFTRNVRVITTGIGNGVGRFFWERNVRTGGLAEVDEDRVFLSVVTLVELRGGVERLAVGERRKRLEIWLQDALPMRFKSRLVPVDKLVANECGRVVARREAQGRPMHVPLGSRQADAAAASGDDGDFVFQ